MVELLRALPMAIYFPRGFNSGEPVRVLDGVTVVRGQLARQPAELLVIAGSRTLLGGIAGPTARDAHSVLRALGIATARRVRALPRRPGTLRTLPTGDGRRRQLGFFEYLDAPHGEPALREVVGIVADAAAGLGAREVALAPFSPDPADARLLVDVLRASTSATARELRWIVVVGSRGQFEGVTAGPVGAPTSP